MQTLKRLTNKFKLDRFERGVWVPVGISTVMGIGFATSFTYLPLYLYEERGISMTLVGTILLVSGLMAAIFQVIGGLAADRFGYRKMVLICQLAQFVALAGLAILIAADGALWGIVLLAILVPVLNGIINPSILATVANASEKSRMTESYGLLVISGNVGWAVGPLLGGYLLGFASYAWLFGIGALFSVLALIGVPFLPAGQAKSDSERLSVKSFRALVSNKTLLLFSLISMLPFLAEAQWGSTLSVFTVDRIGFSTEQYGLLAGISGALIIVFQYPVSRHIGRLGNRKTLVLGSLLYAAGFLSFTWIKTFVPAVGSIVILVAGEMLFVPTALAVAGQLSRPEDRGKSMGLYGLSWSLGESLGPLLGGFLLDAFPTSPFFLWGPISLCAFIAAIGFGIWKGCLDTAQQPLDK